MSYDYIRDGAAIYAKSFAMIRAEADLRAFDTVEEPVAVRIVHACGMVEASADIRFTPGAVAVAKAALRAGAPVLCDVRMVADGVTRRRLPVGNDVICTLNDARVPGLAAELGTTRTAAAVELWRDRLAGAVVAIGNAPTALFHLLEMIGRGAPLPAAIIGMPVGFVGAMESKEALLAFGRVPALVVRGRKGGSPMTAATVNALASDEE
ncbi:MAG: precorrin-8X methylmutase [Janthinobacterium lividum]